jgi:hypothetical protein
MKIIKDEALKLALESLESCDAAHITDGGHQWYDEKLVDTAYAALRSALAEQPAQQPAQQEPVAPTAVEMQNAAANLALMREMWGNSDEPAAKVNDDGFIVETGLLLSPGTKLYTSPQPAQRQWVGLTDEERVDLWKATETDNRMVLIDAIEAKLRSKNI